MVVASRAAPLPQQPSRSGAESTPDTSLTSLQYAAEAVIPWRNGNWGECTQCDGVTQDDLRAFEYFSRIAMPMRKTAVGPQSAIVANALWRWGGIISRHSELEDQSIRSGRGMSPTRLVFRQCRRAI